MSDRSYWTILRSSSIIGGAKVLNILISLIKMKAVAVLLGPAGVGLAGLYLSLIQTASSVSSMGLNNVGTRQIAAANATGGQEAVGRTRRALLWITLWLSLVGAAAFWICSGLIAEFVLADKSRSSEVAWLSLGVALTVAAGSQGALLTGLRRIGDLARINIASGILGASLGILALWFWGTDGVLVMVLTAPVVTFLLGHVFVLRLGPAGGKKSRAAEMIGEWRAMLSLGFAFMISGLVSTVGFLIARVLVQRELGLEGLGHFQAAWAIGMTYIGFVLAAMGTDFYPRLTAVINDHEAATRLVNQQTEVALLLCAPLLIAMIGLAPWVISLLYSDEFGPAVDMLRWQLLADVLKVMSWPLGFVILASGAGKTFVFTETLGMSVFVLGVAIGLPLFGVSAAGVAFLALYVAYLPVVRSLGARQIGFQWARAVLLHAIVVIGCALLIVAISWWSDAAGAVCAITTAAGLGAWSIFRLSLMVEATGRLGRIVSFGERIKKWMSSRL